ncbi:hypothetical protein DFP72DRAFT_1116596 [Ephemerocybe angulata]|uniref:Uncharacterized protein n=1 Tax=Ephemerocybe angulata TaxID=980116 RepID=A0A8H6M8W5_9AGAR|nr:hypothetical protein DFP72DRAFT_1116596 [Tulosesus angulatus]
MILEIVISEKFSQSPYPATQNTPTTPLPDLLAVLPYQPSLPIQSVAISKEFLSRSTSFPSGDGTTTPPSVHSLFFASQHPIPPPQSPGNSEERRVETQDEPSHSNSHPNYSTAAWTNTAHFGGGMGAIYEHRACSSEGDGTETVFVTVSVPFNLTPRSSYPHAIVIPSEFTVRQQNTERFKQRVAVGDETGGGGNDHGTRVLIASRTQPRPQACFRGSAAHLVPG